MANNFWSPFADIFETKTYPHARTLRRSFLQKLWDSFFVLLGKPFNKPNWHFGVFDYLALFIPRLLALLTNGLFEHASSHLVKLLILLLFLVSIPLMIARGVFAAVTTILFLPLIALVHGISRLVSDEDRAAALCLKGKLENGKEQSLNDCLVENDLDLEELDATLSKESENDGSCSSSYQLMVWKKITESSVGKDVDVSSLAFSVEIKINQDKGTKKAQTADKTQADNIHAFFRLNLAKVVTYIEGNPQIDKDDKEALLAL